MKKHDFKPEEKSSYHVCKDCGLRVSKKQLENGTICVPLRALKCKEQQ